MAFYIKDFKPLGLIKPAKKLSLMVLNCFQESHAHSGGSGLAELEHVAILGLLPLVLVSTMSETVIVPDIR